MRAVAGAWPVTREDGAMVVTHDPSKWTAKEGFPLAVFQGPADFSEGRAHTDFKLIGGTDDYSAGLVFGYTGGPTITTRGTTRRMAMWRCGVWMDRRRTVLKHGEHHEQLAKNVWHRLAIVIDGRKVRATVNGGPLTVEHELDAPVHGRLGLWVKPDVTTAFRDWRMTTKGEG